MFFVAEIGSNWEGDFMLASRLIDECKKAGANAVKFQMWRAEDLYDGKYKEYELTFRKARSIKGYCDSIGIEFFCSVFYPEAVEFLEKLGVKRYKIGSRTWLHKDNYSKETIEAVKKTKKTTMYSDGYKCLKQPPTFYWSDLYCISDYPANPNNIDWKEIEHYHGFSDHTLGIETALKFCRLRPNAILEKHIKLLDSKGPDAHFSITTQELAQLITLSTSPSLNLE